MLVSKTLQDKYHEIIQTPIDPSSCASGECISLLYHSEWTTIIVIRSPELEELHSIEVEVTFPLCMIDPAPSSSKREQNEAREFTHSTIKHLKYLLKLQQNGFSLGLISTEGIWSAVIEITDPPDASFFEIIIPPTVT